MAYTKFDSNGKAVELPEKVRYARAGNLLTMPRRSSLGSGRNVAPGLRAQCVRGQHVRCLASRCTCVCHRAFKTLEGSPHKFSGPCRGTPNIR